MLLLLSITAQAQSLAEIARQERARRAVLQKTTRVITNETAKTILPVQEPATPAAAPAPLPAAGEKSTEAPGKPDPLKNYNEDVARLRTELQQLQDREVQLQLNLNELTNQFFAPKTNETARRRAQEGIGKTQNELTKVRSDLEQTRKTLQQMETLGPPRP